MGDDTLERIRECWAAIVAEHSLTCECGPPGSGEACNICELTYLLNETEEPYPHWVAMTDAERDEAIRKAV